MHGSINVWCIGRIHLWEKIGSLLAKSAVCMRFVFWLDATTCQHWWKRNDDFCLVGQSTRAKIWLYSVHITRNYFDSSFSLGCIFIYEQHKSVAVPKYIFLVIIIIIIIVVIAVVTSYYCMCVSASAACSLQHTDCGTFAYHTDTNKHINVKKGCSCI